jgi:hypothetical protein
MQNLFTVIIEYQGGVYTSQNTSENEIEAFKKAIHSNIENKSLTVFKKNIINELNFWVQESPPINLDGLKNVWYFSFLDNNDKRGYCHIVKTDNHL